MSKKSGCLGRPFRVIDILGKVNYRVKEVCGKERTR